MKKILKRTIKAISIFIGSILAFLTLLCTVTLIWGAVQMTRGTVTEAMPAADGGFTPEIRLVVYTDTHNENENVADMINTVYTLFDNSEDYKGVDAFVGLGDFSSIGTEPDYEAYATVLKENIREETLYINVLGNHEFKADNYNELFEKYFPHKANEVFEINGFSLIAFSGERSLTEWTFTPKSLIWLDSAIEEAEKTAGDKPVFVFQHPHPFGTVYGSTIWCTPQLNPVFAGHNKVINFSGHSHFPLNDPRSINQTSYTSVGVGAMARFELDKNYVVGQHPEGYEDAAQFLVVEADADGSVRLRGYDLLSDTFFCDYYIENINDESTYAYTYKNMKAHDSAPVFPENAAVQTSTTENGDIRIEFTKAEASEGFIVHGYELTIKDEAGKTVYEDEIIADYYIISDKATQGFTVPASTLPDGAYTLNLTAQSAYHKHSAPTSLPFPIP